jgi:hypothetical protein
MIQVFGQVAADTGEVTGHGRVGPGSSTLCADPDQRFGRQVDARVPVQLDAAHACRPGYRLHAYD